MARKWVPINPPEDPNVCSLWLYQAWKRLNIHLDQLSVGLGEVARGEIPDGTGRPLFDGTLFFYLPGRPFGQLGFGATESGGRLTLSSTAHSIKGSIYFGSARQTAYDEVNERIGINRPVPAAKLDMRVGAPVNQFSRPEAETNPFFGDGDVDRGAWEGPGGVLTHLHNFIDDVSADIAGVDYIAALSTSSTPYTCALSPVTNPNILTGFTLRVTARNTNTSDPTRFKLTLQITDIGPTVLWTSEQILSGSFTTYPFAVTLTQAPSGGYSNLRFTVLSSYLGGLGFSPDGAFQVSSVELEVPAVGGGSAETLQKWSTPSYADTLDFTADGSGTNTLDLSLAGDAPLRVNAGGGTSGLRLHTLSTNARLEAGAADQANMNLVLSGARSAQGTQLTSDFVNTKILGSLSLPRVAPTATYSILTTDFHVAASGTFTVTLPTAVGVAGKVYNVKNIGTGIITVATTSSQTIDDGSTAVLRRRYTSILLVSNGTNWEII